MTSTTYVVWKQGDLKVGVPKTNAGDYPDHLYIDDEKFTLNGRTLHYRGFEAYECDENFTISKGKEYDAWRAYVNEPVCYETWRSTLPSLRIPNPRNVIVTGESYQVEGICNLWPRPLLKQNGKVAARVREGEVIFI